MVVSPGQRLPTREIVGIVGTPTSLSGLGPGNCPLIFTGTPLTLAGAFCALTCVPRYLDALSHEALKLIIIATRLGESKCISACTYLYKTQQTRANRQL